MARRLNRRDAPRSAFGSIQKVKSKPGFYVCFHYGKKIRRKASNSRVVARRMLEEVRDFAEDGAPLADILAEVFGDVGGSKMTFRQLAGLYKDRTSDYERRPVTVRAEETLVDRVCRAGWTRKRIAMVTVQDILHWRNRIANSVSRPTANRYLAKASVIFKFGIEESHCESNPAIAVRKFSEVGRGREFFFTPSQCQALLACCVAIIRPVVEVAMNTGMRRGELLSLTWGQVDLTKGTLTVPGAKTKNRRTRIVHVNPNVRRVLIFILNQRDGSPRPQDSVFGHSEDQLTKYYNRARYSCSALTKAEQKQACFHTLRHTAASLMIQGDVTLPEIQHVLGHSTLNMVINYAHLCGEAGKDALERLGEMVSGAG